MKVFKRFPKFAWFVASLNVDTAEKIILWFYIYMCCVLYLYSNYIILFFNMIYFMTWFINNRLINYILQVKYKKTIDFSAWRMNGKYVSLMMLNKKTLLYEIKKTWQIKITSVTYHHILATKLHLCLFLQS